MNQITLDYGGQKLQLNKSDKLIGVRTTSNKDDSSTTLSNDEIRKFDIGLKLAQFNVLDVSSSTNEMETMLDQLRNASDIQAGTHVYYTSDDEVPFVPSGDIYLSFKKNATTSQCQKILEKYHLQIVKVLDEKELVVKISKASNNPIKVTSDLQKEKKVVLVAEPDLNTPGRLWSNYVLPTDDLLDRQWHLENTGFHRGTSIGLKKNADARVLKAWKKMQSLGDPSVILAVIDDGFDLNHPDFASPGKIIAPWDFTRNNSNPWPEYEIRDWHGTACAGVAIGSANGIGILGAAPNCRLMPIRWGTRLSDESIENWFDYVLQQGASVVSCSWGAAAKVYRLSTRQKKAIANCALKGRNNKGIVICFAAGNSNRDIDAMDGSSHDGFANHPNVIAVSAINSMDNKSHYSNFGQNISVCAPSSGAGGMGITTSDVTGTYFYNGKYRSAGYSQGDYTDEFGGTSSACPLVAGICALLLSLNPDLHATEVKNIIEQTARKVGRKNDYDKKGHSLIYGYGCIDAEKAVATVLKNYNN